MKRKALWFKKSVENGESNVWLCFKDGMINLNQIAEERPTIIGKNLKNAIDLFIKQESK